MEPVFILPIAMALILFFLAGIEKPVVYWREEPALERFTGGWVVYSRLVISNKAGWRP